MDLQPGPVALVLLVAFDGPRRHLAIRYIPFFSSSTQMRVIRIRRRRGVRALLLVLDEVWLRLSVLLTLSAMLDLLSIVRVLVSDQ